MKSVNNESENDGKCPNCSAFIRIDETSCQMCGFNLTTSDQLDGLNPQMDQESKVTQSSPPWEDNEDDIVVNNLVPTNVIGWPIEIYYYGPVTGYGFMQFSYNGIYFQYPKVKTAGNGRGGFGNLGHLDKDGDIDAEDLGCLFVYGLLLLIGREIEKFLKPVNEQKKIIEWTFHMPYKAIQNITLCGRTIDITHLIRKRGNLKVRVGLCDGERLYRELYFHYPTAISEWKNQLHHKILYDEIVRVKSQESQS